MLLTNPPMIQILRNTENVCQDEMIDILNSTGWSVDKFINDPHTPIYIAIIEKTTA